ncbi:type II toxin-antitoxin system PemK/MazF family toxin [Enterococcus sp. 669A]|uniref:Type II toxin-antitoxin system PemK/MazF family toxin n=1 Tax=Candidatus Enterococcus moelleringii TaxID=2815325 RepID=A0ABS3L721_9ENTE|nr:type II toxin-antitoxin system PemK/MazF family toxin [Enterococcus sp. 669A]MBO1305408.1 type II toxin-antitoxin system PemK/MazF family toxin [Enterococcus sp. 669A]
MKEEKRYIPKKGDLVWIDFDPSAGKEIRKRRPGLIVSRYEFNRRTMFAVVCPITSTVRNNPTRYTLPEELELQGQVLISQLKSLDFTERKIKLVERLPIQDLAKIDQVIDYIFKEGIDR